MGLRFQPFASSVRNSWDYGKTVSRIQFNPLTLDPIFLNFSSTEFILLLYVPWQLAYWPTLSIVSSTISNSTSQCLSHDTGFKSVSLLMWFVLLPSVIAVVGAGSEGICCASCNGLLVVSVDPTLSVDLSSSVDVGYFTSEMSFKFVNGRESWSSTSWVWPSNKNKRKIQSLFKKKIGELFTNTAYLSIERYNKILYDSTSL